MEAAPLNILQRVFRQWERVHPYNAAQILRLSGPADAAALGAAWHDALSSLGLGPVHVRGRRFWYETPPVPTAIPALPPGTDLATYVTQELNRPFEKSAHLPLRPFLLQEAGSHYAGVIYQHWIADSASIRLLLREWFVRRYNPERARREPVVIPRHGYWHYFGPEKSKWSRGGQFLMLAQAARRLRRVSRLKGSGAHDYTMRFTLHRVAPGVLAKARETAHRHGVTLNDLFLACMADVCHRHLPTKMVRRRNDLALGTIVDLRSRSRQKMDDLFGLFLGFANVICRRDDLGNWAPLLRSIADQTRHHKAADVPQAGILWMATALLAGVILPRKKRIPFYRKHMPLAAGISNVNLNHTWAAEYHPSPLMEYIRVSPTGPMVPLVFTPTTLGEDLHFGLTYRTSIISDATAGQMADWFGKCLADLGD